MSIGTGMLIPVLPLYLRDIGFSYTLVTAIISAFALGGLLAQLPAGWAIARWREFPVMIASTALIALSTWLLGIVTVTVGLVGLRLAAGVGSTGWLLSRQTFMTTDVPTELRGRVTSTFGGTNRAAFLAGPVVGGLVADAWGFTAAFAVAGLSTAAGLIPLASSRRFFGDRRARSLDVAGWRSIWHTRRAQLMSAGAVQLGVLAAREGRHAVIPLLGAAIGLDVGSVGLLVAASAVSDLALFPVSGFLMDRHGRVAAIAPSLVLLGTGLFLAGAAKTPATLVGAAIVVGVGNGIGAGTMLTIGSDLAPKHDPSRFLSLLGTIRDTGRVAGPLLVGALADSVGLSWSAVALGIVAVTTAAFMGLVVGDTRAIAG